LWVKFKVPIFGEIRFNPIVSFLSITLIWTFVAVCVVYKDAVPFGVWKSFIVDKFTWLYIGSQDVWAIFAVVLYCSKYANIKLGKPNDKPEYNDVTWFVMLFACGIGVGLFFYGVAEPIFHYTGRNRYV
jgi:choline-glycine betaine transporter